MHSQKFRGNTKSSSLVSKVCFFGRLWGPFLAQSGVGRGSVKVRADVKFLTNISYNKLCEIACSQIVVYITILYSNILCKPMLEVCNYSMVAGSNPDLIPRFLSVPCITCSTPQYYIDLWIRAKHGTSLRHINRFRKNLVLGQV